MSATTPRALPHWAQVPHKAVCSARCSLLTHDCTAKFSSNHIIKFADDTTVVGLISNNDEMHYREEMAQLAEWCGANNLSLNVEKTKEVVMDFRRRNSTDHPPLTIDSSTVRESAALNSWGCTSRRISPGPPTPCHSPRRHNSAYTFSAGWKEQSPTTHPHHILQGHHWECADQLHHCLVRELQCCWPQDPPADSEHSCNDQVPLSHPSWTFSLHDAPAKPTASWRTPPHPSHSLFQLLPSGRRYRSIRARSARLLNSFFPQAVRALNSDHPTPLWNPMQTPTSWNTDHPPPPLSKHPPNLTSPKKKLWIIIIIFFLCNSSVCKTLGKVERTHIWT